MTDPAAPSPPTEGTGCTVAAVAAAYFDFMAERFPVMCASDEFHFFPRAQAAAHHYHRLDDLSEDAVNEVVGRLHDFTRQLVRLDRTRLDLESTIDCRLLEANMAGALIALEENRCWQIDPLLYLKVAFIGLDHAAHKPAVSSHAIDDRLVSRLAALPSLLGHACRQLTGVPESRHAAAMAMVRDAHAWLDQLAQERPVAQANAEFRRLATAAHDALDRFREYLEEMSPVPDGEVVDRSFHATLTRHFQCRLSTGEIFDIADDQWRSALTDLRQLQTQIDPGATWRSIYQQYTPEAAHQNTMDLYRREILDLKRFFSDHGFDGMTAVPPPLVRPTPGYLSSVRSSASFAAALTPDPEEYSYFYVTVAFDDIADPDQRALLAARLHREYAFLTAHETYPGHHYLDSIRRRLANPVRQQVESPLFYEGWATYVEHLVLAHGRCARHIDRLIDAKRRLWRSARCKIDVGLATGRMTREAAAALLIECGFAEAEARRQVRRFQLNPGYQLCYSLGKHEFLRLKRLHGERLGEKRFHACILNGGQLPFDLIDRRLRRVSDTSRASDHGDH